MVTVMILGLTLRNAVGETDLELAAGEAKTVKHLIQANPGSLGALLPFIEKRELLVTVNKKIATVDSSIKDGDTIRVSHQSQTSYDGTRDIPM